MLLVILMLILAIDAQAAPPSLNQGCAREWLSRDCNDDTPFNGYWSEDGWVPGYPDKESWMRQVPVWSFGNAVFYAPWVMEATAEFHGLSLDGYLGGVALMGCGDIGARVWMRRPGYEWEGPYLAVDCATRGDIFPIILFRREIVEVDFPTAQRWGMIESPCLNDCTILTWRIDDVQVAKLPPEILPLIGLKRPVPYPEWWLSLLTLEGQSPPKQSVLEERPRNLFR